MNNENKQPDKETQQNQPLPFEVLSGNIYYQPNKTVVKLVNTEIGLGVFATKNIKKDELIERCPLIQLAWRRKYHGDPQISRYLYTNGSCKCNDCIKDGPYMYIAAGYGMLYNHHDTPNTRWVFNFQKLYADLFAQKDIAKGKQILVSYGEKYFTNLKKIVIDE